MTDNVLVSVLHILPIPSYRCLLLPIIFAHRIHSPCSIPLYTAPPSKVVSLPSSLGLMPFSHCIAALISFTLVIRMVFNHLDNQLSSVYYLHYNWQAVLDQRLEAARSVDEYGRHAPFC